jgi:glycosyltransferase involved in cell wall biosynthesis
VKLSLIVPVYKVQDYIEECLLSIVRQLPSDVEVIIINDGSPDDSMCIVEQVLRGLSENQQKQFVILNQSNQGQSVARNNAIKIAKGRYIGFLDSDDYIADNYFETILTHIEQQPNVDLFSFSAIHFEDVSNKQLGILGDQLPEGLFKNDHIF